MRPSFRPISVAAILAAGAIACSDTPGAPGNPSLSRSQADSVAAVLVADLDGLPDGAVYDPLVGPFPSSASAGGALECQPTISPNPPVNSDDDRIPDSVRVDFTGCVIVRELETITRFGTLDIIDPQPTVAGHHIRSVFTDLGRSVTRNETDATWTIVHNGERRASATATQLQHEEIDFLTEFTFPDGSGAAHLRDWSSTFTADPGLTIEDRHLPAGTWEVNGTSSWTKGDRSWSLAVTTLEPLHFDPSCDFRPRYTDGTIRVVATRGDQQSTVTIEFTACGQYVVTRS